ncbi:flagellar hook-associated protein 2 [Clostridia bacterium]|nr:flagellar hook-associated protein 2 [Clostridia bacterium]
MATSATIVNRVSGMSSGMDTDALVKAMTSNQQLKIDQLAAKRTLAEWKSTAITDNNNLLRTLKDDFLSTLGSKSMMKTTAYNTYSVSGFSNPAIKVTAGAGVKLGMHSVQVNQIATSASATGAKFSRDGYELQSTSISLKYLSENSQYTNTDALTPIVLTDENGSPMLDGEGEAVMGYEFKINGKSFQFKETEKLSAVMEAINTAGAGVKMSFSQLSGSFTLQSTTTGSASSLAVEEDSSNFFAALGLGGGSSGDNVFDSESLVGQDAKLTIDGVSVTRSSNSFTIEGMTFQLNGETTGAVNFSVERDTSAALENVKQFVTAFNDMMTKLDTAYRTKKDGSYGPLSPSVKEGMTETEVKEWEANAKKGLLYRDSNMEKLIDGLRGAVTANIDGLGYLSQFGISTNGYTSGESFRLTIDDDKLSAALEADPDKLYNIMAQLSTKATSGSEANPGGVLTRVASAIDRYTATTKSYDVQNLRDNVLDFTKRIAAQEDKLYELQERYYKKFAAFESALSKMQAQQDTVTNYFG